MSRLRVQHCILNRTTRQYGSHPTSDLLGVDYFLNAPPDTEFPYFIPRLELFVRFLVMGGLSGRIRIKIVGAEAGEWNRRPVYNESYDLPKIEPGKFVVLDTSFKLNYLKFPSEGSYSILLLKRTRREPWEQSRWRVMARETFQISRFL